MYQCILFAVIIISASLQHKCETKEIKTKLQAIITPFDMQYREELNYLKGRLIRTNHTKNRNNIKTKGIYITVWLKKNTQVKFNYLQILQLSRYFIESDHLNIYISHFCETRF